MGLAEGGGHGGIRADRVNTMEKDRAELLELAARLDEDALEHLLSYARFLAGRGDGGRRELPSTDSPVIDPGPDGETVVAAVRRLRRVYSMLDPRLLLGEVGDIMTRHATEGTNTVEAIAHLEEVFLTHYRRLSAPQPKPPASSSD